MAISETQKVDYLWKKLGYGLSKTDTNANKRATNESIASPLLLSGENVWGQSDQIPATIPGSSSGVVTVYPTSSPDETTADTSATTNRTWKTGLTDWIPPEFGSTYLVKAYIHTPGQPGTAASGGTQVFGAGSGNDDEWFFDYQSGILHFIGTNLPSGISGKSLYISGARYTGIKGVAVPGAGVTFTSLGVESLNVNPGVSTFAGAIDANGDLDVDGHTELDNVNVTGVSTFGALVDINNGGQANTFKVEDLTNDQLVIAGTGGELEGDANLTFNGTQLAVGVNLDVDGHTELDNVNVSGVSTFVGITTQTSTLFAKQFSAAGVSTFIGAADFDGNVDIDGHAELDNLGVSGVSTFSDTVNVIDDKKIQLGNDGDLQIYHTGSQSYIDNNTGALYIRNNVDDDDGGNIIIEAKSGKASAVFQDDEGVRLYYNDAEKIATTGYGVTITGGVYASGVSTFASNIDANGNLDVDGQTDLDVLNVAELATFNGNIDVISTDGGSAAAPELKLYRNSGTPADADYLGQIKFAGESDTGVERNYAKITGKIDDASNTNEDGILEFAFIKAGAQNINARFKSTELMLLNGTDFSVAGDSTFTGGIDVDGHTELDDVNVSGALTATSLNVTNKLTSTGIGISVLNGSGDTATIAGPANLILDPGVVGDNTGTVRIKGNFLVDGTTTTVNSTTVDIADKVIGIATTCNTDLLTDGAGIGIGSDKTFLYEHNSGTDPSLKASENLNVPTGKGYQVNQVEVLNATTLGSNVVNSSLTSVGTLNGLDVTGHTELDNLNVSGISTFEDGLTIGGSFSGTDGVVIKAPSSGSRQILKLFGGSATDGKVVIQGHGPNSNNLVANALGATELWWAATSSEAKKLETTGYGVSVFGTAETQQLNVTGVSTFAGNINANGNIVGDNSTNISGINEVTAAGNINANGNIVGDNSTNISGINQVTATTFVGALTGTATTATNLAGGDTGDIPYQSANGTTTFVDATGASTNQVLLWSGSAPVWSNVSAAAGAFGGISVQDDTTPVGTANSVTTLNFAGNNVQATATTGGNGISTITVSDTPTFTSLKVTGISTIPNVSGVTTFSNNVHIGTGITFYASSGIVSATAFYGNGQNLTDLINQRIEGLQIYDEGTPVGTGYTFSGINFTGSAVSVAAVGVGTTAVVTIDGFGPDPQENLYAGTGAGAASDADTCFNIAFGCNAANDLNSGDHNVFLGYKAGAEVTSGSANVFIGKETGSDGVTTGDNNIAMGCRSGCDLTGGASNLLLGYRTGMLLTNGGYNVFLGHSAGEQQDNGSDTISIGRSAGQFGINEYSIYIGKNAAAYGSNGQKNIAIGCGAYEGSSTTSNNTGCCNITLGVSAGRCSTSGSNNVFLGTYSGKSITSGSSNIILGNFAGCSITDCNSNVFAGNEAGRCSDGGYNLYFGYRAGKGSSTVTNNTGGNNIAMAMDAGCGLTSGAGNIFLGLNSGCLTTSGNCNVFLGYNAGNTNTSGCCNIAIGRDVELPSTTANGQMAIGDGTNRWITGDSSFNVTIAGIATVTKTSGQVEATSFKGDGSQLTNLPATTPDKISEGNTEVEVIDTGSNGIIKFTTEGSERARIDSSGRMGIGVTNPVAKLEVNVGSAVTALDIQGSAGQLFSVTNNLTSGSIFSVNDVSGIPSIDVDADGTIQLAPFSTTEMVGVGTTNPTTKLHVIGEVTATDFNSTSDARLKTNVQVIDDPLAKVLQINGVSFNWVENNKPSMGVIADNIEEVLPELVSDTDPKTVNYNGLIGLLIEVVKDQQTQINSLNERLSQLE